MPDDDDTPMTEWGTPIRSREIPGSKFDPPKRELVSVPKRSDYARGSYQDRLGNRGGR
jgi:hypothetical protein